MADRIDLVFPTIHPNGTSKDRLLNDLCKASLVIDIAYISLKDTAPNGRDYYPQGPNAIERAVEQHLQRLSRLDDVKRELDAIIERISDTAE